MKLFLLALVFVGSSAEFLSILQLPRHDGVRRVSRLGEANFTSEVSAVDIAVVVISDGAARPGGKSSCEETDDFAEVTAQLLSRRGVKVFSAPVDVVQVQHPQQTVAPTAGDVYIYRSQRRYIYYGRRSAPALLSFLVKLNSTKVQTITGKLDKIAFDQILQPKIVGFFMQGTADHAAFEEAAALLSPSVTFYAVYDRTVAKHLKLDAVGQINLHRPFEKQPIACPVNPASAADIKAFVTQNRGVVLTKVDEHNMYDSNLVDPSRVLIIAIAEQSSSLGGYFHHLLTRLIRNNTNSTEFQRLNILWVEPQIFPTVYVMMDQLESTLGIPNRLPVFGTLNLTENQSAWFNTDLLNTTADKTADEQNLKLLQEWVDKVLAGTVRLAKVGTQSFSAMPASQQIVEGSDAVLECVISNIVGDCLWLKDGQNIGFNLARYPQLSWRGDTTAGDCSLKITSAQRGRDDGRYVCEVTGDAENPTVTSSPATITVIGKTEL